MQLRLRFITDKGVHSDSQLSYLFLHHFGLDNGSTLDIDFSIEHNAKKYGIENSILHEILKNTARRYDVYMTSQGDVYHRGDCHELEGSKIIQISLDEAKRLEYEFCDSCKRRKSTLS